MRDIATLFPWLLSGSNLDNFPASDVQVISAYQFRTCK
ncbi:hypothetical protein ECNE037_1233 [Escherichia coli NE037]|nr:hypothetical protein ECNE037_1233 [Escherichia coli NE037]